MGEGTVGKNLHQLLAVDVAGGAKLVKTDFLKLLLGSECLEHAQIDGLVFNAVDILEAPFGETALEGHLAAFKTDFLFVAGARFCAFVSAGRCSTLAGTGTATDAGAAGCGSYGGF